MWTCRFFILVLVKSFLITSNAEQYTLFCDNTHRIDLGSGEGSGQPETSIFECSMQAGINLVGPQGEIGERGPQGLKGQQGEPGKRGPYGNFGPQGPMGRPGQKGASGARGLEGLDGLMGLTGPEGPRGAKGDKGEVADVGNKVDRAEFEAYKQLMENKITLLTEKLGVLENCCTGNSLKPGGIILPTATTHPGTSIDPTESPCVIIYEGKCYKIIGVKGWEKGTEEHSQDCLQMGGKLADFYSEQQMNETVEAIREYRLPYRTFLILGMKYDIFKRQLLFSNGTEAHIPLKWRKGNPTFYAKNTDIQLLVDVNPYTDAQGLYNRPPEHVRAFSLCELDIVEDYY